LKKKVFNLKNDLIDITVSKSGQTISVHNPYLANKYKGRFESKYLNNHRIASVGGLQISQGVLFLIGSFYSDNTYVEHTFGSEAYAIKWFESITQLLKDSFKGIEKKSHLPPNIFGVKE